MGSALALLVLLGACDRPIDPVDDAAIEPADAMDPAAAPLLAAGPAPTGNAASIIAIEAQIWADLVHWLVYGIPSNWLPIPDVLGPDVRLVTLDSIGRGTSVDLTIVQVQSPEVADISQGELESGIVPAVIGVFDPTRARTIALSVDGSAEATLLDGSTAQACLTVPAWSEWDPTLDPHPPMVTLGSRVAAIGVDDHWTDPIGGRISLEAIITEPQLDALLDEAPLDSLALELDALRQQKRLAFQSVIGEGPYGAAGLIGGQRSGDASIMLAAADPLQDLDAEALGLGVELGLIFVAALDPEAQGPIAAGFYRLALENEPGEPLLATWTSLDTELPVFVSEAAVTTQPGSPLEGVVPQLSFDDGGYTVGASWSPAASETQVTVSIALGEGSFGPS